MTNDISSNDNPTDQELEDEGICSKCNEFYEDCICGVT